MHRTSILEQLQRYRPLDEADHACCERFVAFVKRHSDCFERSLAVGHVTSSAWLVDGRGQRVLLTHHRKLDKWLQLGGHADGECDPLAVALKEAREESGLENIHPLSEAIFDLDIHPFPARKDVPQHLHYDVRYTLQARGSEQVTPSAESLALAWVDIDALQRYAPERGLLRMREKWNRLLRSR